jgi:ABC-2 type transport system ATP-binding protein
MPDGRLVRQGRGMITVESVTKTYGSFLAVDDVSFVCRPGQVTGFLGPNGAGKSTTMRIMVGLTPASRGRVMIGGHRYADLPNPGRHVGVLLDASAQHAGRTGREVLTIGAITMGLPVSRVDELLELVSLTQSEARRRVKNYSLGMRQRLGIAHALLGDPKILVLDEPANGLDPAGIHWMRGLLREYAAQGGTVCLSSHLLHEVERIADELILIGHGRIVAQGTKQELLHTRGAFVKAVEHDRLVDALHQEGITALPSGDGLRSDAETIHVGKVAAANNITLIELRPAEGEGLEEMFLQLTADTQRDTAPEGAVA